MIPDICPECGHDRFVTSCYRAAGVTAGKTNCQRCGLLVATETPAPERRSWLDDLGLGSLREWFAPAPARPSAPRHSVPLRPLTPEESHARLAAAEPAPAPAPGGQRTWVPSPPTLEEPVLPELELTPEAPPEATIVLDALPLAGPPSEATESAPAWEAPVAPEDERTAPKLSVPPVAPAAPAPATTEPPAAEPAAPEPAAVPATPSSEVRTELESRDSEQLSTMLGRSAALGWSPAVFDLVQQILRDRQVPLPPTASARIEHKAEVVPVATPPAPPARVPLPPTAPVPRPAPAPQLTAEAAPPPPPPPVPVARPATPAMVPTPAPAVPRVLVRPGRSRPLPTIAAVEGLVPTGDLLCDPLLDIAHPQLYCSNAFRVTGLPVEATTREIARQAEKLRMLEKLGGGTATTPGGPLALDPPPTAEGVRDALQRLGDPERRLIDEILWVWGLAPGAAAPDEALDAFVAGQTDAALERWMLGEVRAPEAMAARHNLAVVHHVRALDLELRAAERPLTQEEREEREACWSQALPRWRAMISLEPFWTRVTERVRALDDPRLTTGAVRRVRASLPLALLLVDARLTRAAAERGEEREAERHRRRMTGYALGTALVEEALKRAATPVWEQVQQLCRSTEPKADADPPHADRVARDLLRQAAPLLRTLDLLLPDGHATRVGAHDEVALRALACQITFSNKTEDWATSLTLLKAILPIASSNSARGRIEETIHMVERLLQLATCWFCKKQPSQERATVNVEMYGNVVRVPVWNGVQVQWQKVTLLVPRCGDCQARQARAGTAMALGIVGGLVTGGGLAVITGGHPVGLVFGLFFVIGGITLGALRRTKALAGIHDEAHKNEFPTVKEKRAEGWLFGRGPQG